MSYFAIKFCKQPTLMTAQELIFSQTRLLKCMLDFDDGVASDLTKVIEGSFLFSLVCFGFSPSDQFYLGGSALCRLGAKCVTTMVLPSKGWFKASRNQAWHCRPSSRTASDKKRQAMAQRAGFFQVVVSRAKRFFARLAMVWIVFPCG